MHKTPRAHEITDRLSFSLTSLSNLRFFDFVVVFFLFVGFKSGTIRNALAAATSAHTDHRAHAVALKWEGEKGPLGIAPHQQAHAEQASTSSPQHCSGDTENEDARAAAATVVVAPKICCCCCCSGLTSGTVPPQHLGTITFPTSGGSDFDACVSARGLSLKQLMMLFFDKSKCSPRGSRLRVLANFGSHCAWFGGTDYDRLRKSSRARAAVWSGELVCPHTEICHSLSCRNLTFRTAAQIFFFLCRAHKQNFQQQRTILSI